MELTEFMINLKPIKHDERKHRLWTPTLIVNCIERKVDRWISLTNKKKGAYLELSFG